MPTDTNCIASKGLFLWMFKSGIKPIWTWTPWKEKTRSWAVTSEILKILSPELKISPWVRARCIPKSWNSTKPPSRCFPGSRLRGTEDKSCGTTCSSRSGGGSPSSLCFLHCSSKWTGGDGHPSATLDMSGMCSPHVGYLLFLVYLQPDFCASVSPRRYA